MSEETEAKPAPPPSRRQRLTGVFGWVAGVAVGLLASYLLSIQLGEGHEKVTTVTTFAFIVVGGFSGVHLADRLGERGFKPLGITAGVCVALVLSLLAATLLSGQGS